MARIRPVARSGAGKSRLPSGLARIDPHFQTVVVTNVYFRGVRDNTKAHCLNLARPAMVFVMGRPPPRRGRPISYAQTENVWCCDGNRLKNHRNVLCPQRTLISPVMPRRIKVAKSSCSCAAVGQGRAVHPGAVVKGPTL